MTYVTAILPSTPIAASSFLYNRSASSLIHLISMKLHRKIPDICTTSAVEQFLFQHIANRYDAFSHNINAGVDHNTNYFVHVLFTPFRSDNTAGAQPYRSTLIAGNISGRTLKNRCSITFRLLFHSSSGIRALQQNSANSQDDKTGDAERIKQIYRIIRWKNHDCTLLFRI